MSSSTRVYKTDELLDLAGSDTALKRKLLHDRVSEYQEAEKRVKKRVRAACKAALVLDDGDDDGKHVLLAIRWEEQTTYLRVPAACLPEGTESILADSWSGSADARAAMNTWREYWFEKHRRRHRDMTFDGDSAPCTGVLQPVTQVIFGTCYW